MQRFGFPLLQLVDALLSEAVFLAHLGVFVVVLAAQQLFLLFETLVLAREAHQVDFED